MSDPHPIGDTPLSPRRNHNQEKMKLIKYIENCATTTYTYSFLTLKFGISELLTPTVRFNSKAHTDETIYETLSSYHKSFHM